MKVLHVLPSSDMADGGAVHVVMELTSFLAKKGLDITIFAPLANGRGLCDYKLEGVNAIYFPKDIFSKYWFGCSRLLTQAMFKKVSGFDLIHTHGMWHYPQFIAYWAAKIAKKPVVATVHGGLSPESLKYKPFQKKIYSAVIQKKILKEASAIHALSRRESKDILRFVNNQNIFIIPNGINSEEFAEAADNVWIKNLYPQLKNKKIILFLGRISEGKGLDVLAKAFGKVCRERGDVYLLIVGPDNWGYKPKIEKILKEQGILNRVIFTGMLTGPNKKAVLSCADIFILPSSAEGFSISVLEAMNCGLPVIISRQCNFPEVEKINAGRIIEPEVEQIEKNIIEFLDQPELCKEMGDRGRALVKEKHSWDKIADEMIVMYKRIINSERL